MSDSLKNIPPQDLEAERMVLGAVLIDNNALAEIDGELLPTDFYRTAHGDIFTAMQDMHARREAIDLITLTAELRKTDGLKNVGGATYLSELVSFAATAANIKHHARLIVRASQLRTVQKIASEIMGRAYQGEDPETVITDLVACVDAARRGTGTEIITQKELMRFAFVAVEERYKLQGRLSGIPSGFVHLDDMLDGFQPGDLIYIGGRPSMGKSALAECIGDNVAMFFDREARDKDGNLVRKPDAVGEIHIEMSKRQIALRAISRASGISNSRIRRGHLQEQDWDTLARGAGAYAALPIVYETVALDDRAVKRTIDIMVQRHGCRMILVDYLQLMARAEGEGRNREQEVAAQSRMLKIAAKQHNIPVIVLSQLNRSLESRTDKRPILADLRESGAIEQDADVIMFVYRDEVYNKCECGEVCMCSRRGRAEVLIRKQRMGPCGDVELRWLAKQTKFVDP